MVIPWETSSPIRNKRRIILMTSGIYKITNKHTGQVYIGQSDNCERRLNEHQQKRQVPIDMWINMLGKDSFIYEVLEYCPLQELDIKEQEYIEKYDSINNGYNIQSGGYNNSIGNGNGRSKLTEQDVIIIRNAYNNHKAQKETYKQFKEKITFSQFQAIWQGKSWKHIMPEVFTKENKDFYTHQRQKENISLTKEEVLFYRKYYVNHTAKETYNKFCEDKGKEYLKQRTFERILIGDVRPESVYLDVPIYKKSLKKWELRGNPVSTIFESEE